MRWNNISSRGRVPAFTDHNLVLERPDQRTGDVGVASAEYVQRDGADGQPMKELTYPTPTPRPEIHTGVVSVTG